LFSNIIKPRLSAWLFYFYLFENVVTLNFI
jgi:hypothetical protein